MTHTIELLPLAGPFAENKDLAKSLRLEQIIPILEKGGEVILDFNGVTSTTQSFIHALISDLLRVYGDDVLDKVLFKNCSETIKKIVSIVIDYMQQSR